MASEAVQIEQLDTEWCKLSERWKHTSKAESEPEKSKTTPLQLVVHMLPSGVLSPVQQPSHQQGLPELLGVPNRTTA